MATLCFLETPLAACFSIGAVFVVMGIGVLALIATIPTKSSYQDGTIRTFGQVFLLFGFGLVMAACLLKYRKYINRQYQSQRRPSTERGRVNLTLVDEYDAVQGPSRRRGSHQAGVLVPETPPPSYEFSTQESLPPTYSAAIQGANSQSPGVTPA